MKCSYTGLGKQTLEGHKQNLVCTRTQEKEALILQETDSDLPVSVQESPEEAWLAVTCCRVGSVAVRAPDLLKEVTIIFISEVKSLIRVRLFVTPWDSPGKSTGVGCPALLQGIFPTQGSNPGLLHSRQRL